MAKQVNGVYEYKLLYSGQLSPVARLNANNEIVEQYVYGTRVNVPDYMIKNGRKYRILTDHKGSVRMVVDTHNWEIVQQTEYSPFGMIIDEQLAEGWEPVLFGYAGGLQDRDTGLVRFGARDYDPEVGRWTSKEPLGFNGASNFYVYAGNDPVNFVDITGLKPVQCTDLLTAMKLGSKAVYNEWSNFQKDLGGASKEAAFNTEFGTIIYMTGSEESPCYWYAPITQGNTGMNWIDIKKMIGKVPPGATPLISIHNHPNAGTDTIGKDNRTARQEGVLNAIIFQGYNPASSSYGNVTLFDNGISKGPAKAAFDKLSPSGGSITLFNVMK